jgi:hypothetical protein
MIGAKPQVRDRIGRHGDTGYEGSDMETLKRRCQQVSVSLAVDPAGAWAEVAM